MEVMAGFIVGFDNDPEDIFERMIEFIRESAIPMAMVGMLNALPDTQLWKRLEREGRLLGDDATGNNTIATVNFIPKMDVETLVDWLQNNHAHDLQTERVLSPRARLVATHAAGRP